MFYFHKNRGALHVFRGGEGEGCFHRMTVPPRGEFFVPCRKRKQTEDSKPRRSSAIFLFFMAQVGYCEARETLLFEKILDKSQNADNVENHLSSAGNHGERHVKSHHRYFSFSL
jgi:hypothetical protein